MKKFLPNILLGFWVLFLGSVSLAEDVLDTIAYKLAIFHTQTTDPDAVLMNQPIEPNRALVTEFHWILESLKNRCLNPETALADTIMETWQYVQARRYSISLLEISRELLKTARNRTLFGEEKVNFRMTSAYWIKQFENQTREIKKDQD